MTFTGKLLVVVNFLLSLMFMGFALFVYNTRVIQKANLDKKDEAITGLKKEVTNEKEGRAQDVAKLQNDNQALKKNIDRLNQQYQDLTKSSEQLKKDGSRAKTEVTGSTTTEKLMAAELSARNEEIKRIYELRDKLLRDNGTLVKEKADVNDQLALVKSQFKDLKERNEEVVGSLKKLEKFVVDRVGKMPDLAELNDTSVNKMPPDVEGKVLKVDRDGKLVQLSIGQDDGIRVGHVMEVWRTTPDAKYVGQIRITAAEASTAIGSPISGTGVPIRVSDNVGSKIPVGK